MKWHGYLATLAVLAAAGSILAAGAMALDGRHLLMFAGAGLLVWSLRQPVKKTTN